MSKSYATNRCLYCIYNGIQENARRRHICFLTTYEIKTEKVATTTACRTSIILSTILNIGLLFICMGHIPDSAVHCIGYCMNIEKHKAEWHMRRDHHLCAVYLQNSTCVYFCLVFLTVFISSCSNNLTVVVSIFLWRWQLFRLLAIISENTQKYLFPFDLLCNCQRYSHQGWWLCWFFERILFILVTINLCANIYIWISTDFWIWF